MANLRMLKKVQKSYVNITPILHDVYTDRNIETLNTYIPNPPTGNFHPKDSLTFERDIVNLTKVLKEGEVNKLDMVNSPMAFSCVPYERERVFMGFEWEVRIGGRYSVLPLVQNHMMKSEIYEYMTGHYDEGDIELVTTPCTLEYHKRYFDKVIAPSTVYKAILHDKANGQQAGIGLHVHVDLRSFNHASMMKFLTFMSRSTNEHTDALTKFFGRTYARPVHKCDIVSGVFTEVHMKPRDLTDLQKGFIGKTRYETNLRFLRDSMCNLEAHQERTLEFRVFKSPGNKRDLYSKLEFTDALVRFCRRAKLSQLDLYHFASFVKGNENRYPHLVQSDLIEKYSLLKGYKGI